MSIKNEEKYLPGVTNNVFVTELSILQNKKKN